MSDYWAGSDGCVEGRREGWLDGWLDGYEEGCLDGCDLVPLDDWLDDRLDG